MKYISIAIWLTVAAATALGGQTAPPVGTSSGERAPPAASALQASYLSYRIGPRDLVAISVAEIPELSVERRVTDAGTIALPRVGDVAISGLTQSEAVRRLTELLETCCVRRASVEIEIREFRSRPITLIGAVNSPGPLAFSGRWTLVEAIAAAGGLAPGHGDTIFVLRRADNGLTDQVAISVLDLMVKADPRANIPILANDLINVPATVQVTIYTLGEVAAPGAVVFTSSERITVLSVIARAGGLSDRASNNLIIRRRSGPDAGQDVKVDYRRIVNGRDPDPVLGEGDILIVKEAFF
jgi:polysaccharide export outer membrane protein